MDRNFEFLPPHVIAQFLSFLKFADFKNAVLVCKSWYNGSCRLAFGRNIQITLEGDRIDQFHLIQRPFNKLNLCHINFNAFDYQRILTKIQFCVEELSIHRCFISHDQLFEALNILYNLEVLELKLKNLTDYDENDYNGSAIIVNRKPKTVDHVFDRMKRIDVYCWLGQTDGINKILNRCPNLDCLTYHTLDIDKPEYYKKNNQIIAGIAQWNGIDMAYLNIDYYGSAANCFMKQMQTLNIIRLDKLIFPRYDDNEYDTEFDVEFDKFCKHFNVLKDFEMWYARDVNLISICENLKNLKRLSIVFLGDELHHIGGLDNLEALQLEIKENHPSDSLIQQLFSVNLPKLTVLWLEKLPLSKAQLTLLCNSFQNLTELKIKLCTSDCSAIFKNLTQLKLLWFYICDTNSDDHREGLYDVEFNILNLKKLEELKLNKFVPGVTEELLRLLPGLKNFCDTVNPRFNGQFED